MKEGITLITPTGDRPMAFKLCEQWMSRQTKPFDQWIIVDDGHHPTVPTMGQEYFRREALSSDPPHISQCKNLLEALPHIRYKKILIIEDDDYYSPKYIETMSKWLDRNHIVGQDRSIYYNIKHKWYIQNRNNKHCSLCQTGFTHINISILEDTCKAGVRYVDHIFWRNAVGRRFIESEKPKMVIGIKGMPGRGGIAPGHERRASNDPVLSIFKQYIGDDAEVYINFLGLKSEASNLPADIQKCRRDANGNFILVKNNPRLERLLDTHCERIYPRGLVWKPKLQVNKTFVKEMKDQYSGQMCYIVGKGPSLDKIKRSKFRSKYAPIICLNESIHKIEELDLPNPLYCIQQDPGLKETCWSKKGTMLISYLSQAWYREHENVIYYNPNDLVTKSRHPLSIEMAIYFAKLWKCKGIRFIACDALKNGDCSYAGCIGYESTRGGDPKRFIQHKRFIDEALGNLPYKYL